MEKITDRKKVLFLTLLFMALYLISYVTRINYAAIISEMVAAEGIQKSTASLALTASAVTYGVGQLLSGFLGDRVSPKKLIFGGLMLTIMMNLLIPFCVSAPLRAAVWGVNGLAQAFMWPPLVKLMTALFSESDYKKSCVVVSWGSSFGTVLVYLLAPICIWAASWKAIFFLSAFLAAVMAAVWLKNCPEIVSDGIISRKKASGKQISSEKISSEEISPDKNFSEKNTSDIVSADRISAENTPPDNVSRKAISGSNTPAANTSGSNSPAANTSAENTPGSNSPAAKKHGGNIFVQLGVKGTALTAVIMLVIVFQGALRDGVTTWVPSYVSETFHLSSSIAILTSVILPLFSVAALQAVAVIYKRFVKNELFLSGLLFAAGFAAALLLFLANNVSAVLSVALAAVLTGCMHGANLILTCMIPPHFARFGRISFISGLLNFCAYVGSAASASGMAAFSEGFGWRSTLLLWSIISAAGAVICCTVFGIWNRFKTK